MKKIFLLIIVLCLSAHIVYANYQPIPQKSSLKYKKEVTRIINKYYPIAVQETKQMRNDAHNMYLKVLEDKNLYMDYATKNYDINIDYGEYILLTKIIDITDKYVSIKNNSALATDFNGILFDFLFPYFEDNKINTDKLKSLRNLINIKYKEIEQEQEILYKYVYPNEN